MRSDRSKITYRRHAERSEASRVRGASSRPEIPRVAGAPLGMTLLVLLSILAGRAGAQEKPTITLSVDATEAARRVFRASVEIPAKAGPLTLVYPKWIPGTHSPSNPVNSLVGLKVFARE